MKDFLLKLLGGYKVVLVESNKTTISHRVLTVMPGQTVIYRLKTGICMKFEDGKFSFQTPMKRL